MSISNTKDRTAAGELHFPIEISRPVYFSLKLGGTVDVSVNEVAMFYMSCLLSCLVCDIQDLFWSKTFVIPERLFEKWTALYPTTLFQRVQEQQAVPWMELIRLFTTGFQTKTARNIFIVE